MTENKRFKLGYMCGDYGLIDNNEWIDLHSMCENSEKNVQICINKMNELSDENEQLKFKINERINIIKKSIDSFCDDGVEYIPISTVEYYINTIKRELKE